MVLLDGVKYACEVCPFTPVYLHYTNSFQRCVRGHRVSTCNHTDKPLMIIKRKGRPSTQCGHCKDARVLSNTHSTCICGKKSDSTLPHSPDCDCLKGGHCVCGAKKKLLPSAFSSPGELQGLTIYSSVEKGVGMEAGAGRLFSYGAVPSNKTEYQAVSTEPRPDVVFRGIGAEAIEEATPVTAYHASVGEVNVTHDDISNPYTAEDMNHVLGDIPLPFMATGGLLDIFADPQGKPQREPVLTLGRDAFVASPSLTGMFPLYSPSGTQTGETYVKPESLSLRSRSPPLVTHPSIGLAPTPSNGTSLTATSQSGNSQPSIPQTAGLYHPTPPYYPTSPNFHPPIHNGSALITSPQTSTPGPMIRTGSGSSYGSGAQHAAVHQLAHHHNHNRHNPHNSFYTQQDASAFPPHFHPYKAKRSPSVRSATSVGSHKGQTSPSLQTPMHRVESTDSLNAFMPPDRGRDPNRWGAASGYGLGGIDAALDAERGRVTDRSLSRDVFHAGGVFDLGTSLDETPFNAGSQFGGPTAEERSFDPTLLFGGDPSPYNFVAELPADFSSWFEPESATAPFVTGAVNLPGEPLVDEGATRDSKAPAHLCGEPSTETPYLAEPEPALRESEFFNGENEIDRDWGATLLGWMSPEVPTSDDLDYPASSNMLI